MYGTDSGGSWGGGGGGGGGEVSRQRYARLDKEVCPSENTGTHVHTLFVLGWQIKLLVCPQYDATLGPGSIRLPELQLWLGG